mgnify:FL=1
MLVIFTENRTERFIFSVGYFCKDFFNTEYTLTNDVEEYKNSVGIKINYSNKDLPGWQIKPSAEIWTIGIIDDYKPSYHFRNGHLVFYPQDTKLGFDPFAMIFWCLSRYEEYQKFETDKHGRFLAKNQVIEGEKIYRKPYLDYALSAAGQILELDKKIEYQNTPTLDIDMAFMYAGKFFLRRWTSWWKSTNKIAHLKHLFLNRPHEDPFAFGSILREGLSKKPESRVFFLMGEYGMYDKNISHKYPPMQALIKNVQHACKIGLHPSYLGNDYPEKWQKEKKNLDAISHTTIKHSRQHYLKLQFGENATYNHLILMGITDDYTMGFSDDTGYRAGTACSFNWFCLHSNKAKPLRIHPFCAMDVVLKNTLNLGIEEAETHIEAYKKEAKQLKIPFITLFHNESASGYGAWKGWDRIFAMAIE